MEKSSEQDLEEIQQIYQMFPNAKFCIAIKLDDLDDIISERNNIVVKQDYNCYCYKNFRKKTDYFYIKGQKLTNKFIISKLIEQGLELDCNHCFIEGFYKIKNSDCQFEIMIGS